MSIKNSNDTIGNRNRDLPAYSAVPQPTTPPRAPNNVRWFRINTDKIRQILNGNEPDDMDIDRTRLM
jgi:hypothetical protein